MNVIEMRGITKNFGTTHALKSVDFDLRKGEILSLMGENGAGKTTLMRVLYGMYVPDEGEMFYHGEKIEFHRPIDAIRRGICMVHQHFMLVPFLSVTDNIIAGDEPTRGLFLDKKKARAQVKSLIDEYHFNLDPDALVDSLSVGERQRVEILKALYRDAKILILDEPSAVLTPSEVDELFVSLRLLKQKGTSIVIITHKLYETLSIADRIAVLRDGVMIDRNVDPKGCDSVSLSEMMVGRPIKLDEKHPSQNIGEPYFCVEDLCLEEDGIEKLKHISFQIRKGEIYGIAGVEGNGQTQLLDTVTGGVKPKSMKLTVDGKEISGDAHDFIQHKIGHVPADRMTQGLALPMSVRENMILGYHDFPEFSNHGFLKQKHISEYAKTNVERYQIKTASIEMPVGSLSGGNQQKVVMARVLSRDLDVLVVAHPTRGVDIGSSEYLHKQILNFRDQGKAVLLISADLDEVCTLSDRLAVIYDGKLVAECKPEEYSKIQLGLLMTGSPLEDVIKGANAHA